MTSGVMPDLRPPPQTLAPEEKLMVSTPVKLADGRLVGLHGSQLKANDIWEPIEKHGSKRSAKWARRMLLVALLPVVILLVVLEGILHIGGSEAIAFRGWAGSIASGLPGEIQQGKLRFRPVLGVTSVRLLIWLSDTQRADSSWLAWQIPREQVTTIRSRRRWFRVFAEMSFSDGSMVRLKTASNDDSYALAVAVAASS
jgi:hypothetical protein